MVWPFLDCSWISGTIQERPASMAIMKVFNSKFRNNQEILMFCSRAPYPYSEGSGKTPVSSQEFVKILRVRISARCHYSEPLMKSLLPEEFCAIVEVFLESRNFSRNHPGTTLCLKSPRTLRVSELNTNITPLL